MATIKTAGPIKPSAKYRDSVIATLEQMVKEEQKPVCQAPAVGHVSAEDADGRTVFAKCRYVLARCESPIERRLLFALSFELFMAVDVQIPLGSYRADFGFKALKLAVECDGHEFHKSKEQRTHDAQRDRVFTTNGWQVIRFTGGEITANPDQCAAEVARIYESVLEA